MKVVNGIRVKDKDDEAPGKRRDPAANKARTPMSAKTKVAAPITSRDVGSGAGNATGEG